MRQARFALTIALAAALAACAGPGPAATPTGAAPSPGQSGARPLRAARRAPRARPRRANRRPSASDAPTKAPPATESPTDATEAPSASGGSDAAAACTGTDENRAFFANAAKAVDWTVVCAVLPNRWFVSAGSYRQAKGGRLTISYKGPHNATLSLSEGAWCTDPGGCAPDGTEVGPAALGPMQGTLFQLADGGFAIAVDQGEAVSWLLETQGLDQASTEELGAAAVAVSGLADAHRRLRARAVLRPLRVRRPSPAVCVGPRGPADGRAPGDGRPGGGGPVARPAARLHGVARPPVAAARDRRALRHRRPRRGGRVQRRRGGDLRHRERPPPAGRPRDRRVAGLPEPARGRAGIGGRRDAPRAARGRWVGDRRRRHAPPGHAADAADRGQRPAQPHRLPPGRRDLSGGGGARRGRRRDPPVRRGLPVPRARPRRPAAGRRGRRRRTGCRSG